MFTVKQAFYTNPHCACGIDYSHRTVNIRDKKVQFFDELCAGYHASTTQTQKLTLTNNKSIYFFISLKLD